MKIILLSLELSGYLVCGWNIDYSLFKDIGFHLPKFQIIGTYKLNFSALYIFIPLAFVTIMEHIGDHEVLGAIMDRDFLVEPGLKRTLMGDGIATLAAGLIGAPANTSYGENTGVVALTKVGSVWVTGGQLFLQSLLAFIKPINVFITRYSYSCFRRNVVGYLE